MIASILNNVTLCEPQSSSAPFNQDSMFPSDLCEWIAPAGLVKLVLEAVQTVYWSSRDESGVDADSCHPQLILGLLAYSYATGLYSADEIAQRTATDDALGYLCLNNRFPFRQLHLFRSQNRELLRHCLSRVLRRAWEIWFGESSRSSIQNTLAHARLQLAYRNYFDDEAGSRVNQAFRADYPTVALNHAERCYHS
jgi:hypothetical protein